MWPRVKNTRSHQRQGEVGGGREVLPTPRGQAPGIWKLLIYAPPPGHDNLLQQPHIPPKVKSCLQLLNLKSFPMKL